MYLTSPFAQPPHPSDVNASQVILDRPVQQQEQPPWDKDYTLYIDLKTGERQTFREFKADVGRARTALANIGFGKGDLVGIMCETCMDFPLLVHALISLTVPFALIAPYSTPFELAHALKLTGVKKVFVGPKQVSLPWPVGTDVFVMNGRVEGRRCLRDLIREVTGPIVEIQPANKDDLAYLVFSSGTSGLPKAVMLTHGNLIYSFYQVAVIAQAVLDLGLPQPASIPIHLAFLPIHHSYGLHTYCFRSFLSPTTFVMQGRWNLKEALNGISKYQVTALNLIPSVVAQMVAHPSPGIVRDALKSLRNMGSGAAYLPPELARRMRTLLNADLRMSEGYGMSEATITATVQPYNGMLNGTLSNVEGSCGVLFPGMEAKILDDAGVHVKVGEVGELWLKGWNVSPGYYGSSPEVKKANEETFVNGWLRTGDRFYIDEGENFFFADRSKDTLKISGAQVSPLELENVLLSHPAKLISDVAVAGISGLGRTKDERVPKAWVVLSEVGKDLVKQFGGGEVVQKELLKWCEAQVSSYKWLRGGVEIVDEIPKSPTGKTLRRLLVARHEDALGDSRVREAKL